MQIDPSLQSKAENHKLISNLVLPRPIAWVSTINQAGVVNLAPFSFFNAVAADPLYVVIGIGVKETGQQKDTAINIEASGEFVVNLVTEDLFAAMNISSADFPADESELVAAQLRPAASVRIKAPRVEQAQVSLECKLFSAQPLGSYTLVIGEVVMVHVAEQLIGPRMQVMNFAPIGRLGSPSVYCRTTDRFEAPRFTYAQWRKKSE